MAPRTRRPRVAVVGGSLGGLTAALVLRDVGCDVHVYERSHSALEARGAGIVVLDATVRYFVEHDPLDVEALTTATDYIRYLRPDGSLEHETPQRYRYSSWNTIYRALLGCFDEGRYHLGAEMVGFDQDADGVDVRFADGTTTRCDLLVCADGINSTGRNQLFPEVQPEYSGYVAWRGVVPEQQLGAATVEALREAVLYQVPEHSHVLVYPIPGQDGSTRAGERLSNVVWYRNVEAGDDLRDLLTDREGRHRPVSLPPGAVADRHVEQLHATARAQLAPPIAEVVLGVPEPFVQVVFDVESPAMVSGRVCVLGDGAFAARPHAAAGTAKAAENAWALGEAVEAADGDVVAALVAWEPDQLKLGRDLVARAREIGERAQFRASYIPGDPYLIFGLHGPGR